MTDFISSAKAVDSILAKARASYSYQPAEVLAYQENPKVYQALLERMRNLPVRERVACLDRFEDLGALVVQPPGGESPYLAPYLSDPVIIQGLVEFLGDEHDEVRESAARQMNQTGLRSFRVHVIEGLSRAYPMESLLWKPNGTPRDEAYYDAIENWAEEKLGVRWEAPPPPFLYQMDVPTPMGP